MAVNKAYLAAVAAASQKYGVPAKLLAAQIQAESNWNPNAQSSAGATGISQFMPGTAKGMGIDPHDPLASIDAQGKMMGRLIKSYGGNEDKALAAYNAGAGNVAKYNGIPPFPETKSYISNIHKYEQNYPGLSQGTYAKAAAYKRVLSGVSTASVTSPNASLDSGQGDPSSGGYDASQALTGYLVNQSTGHGGDPTQELLGLLQANQATLDVPTARGSKSIPVQRTTDIPPDAGEASIVKTAKDYLGVKYKWGGTDPKSGFDCSGFVQYVQRLQGVTVPRTTYQQLKAGKAVSKDQLQPGDAVFFHDGSHEGMYIGNGKFIQAPHTGDVVKISDLNTYPGFYAARRFTKAGSNA